MALFPAPVRFGAFCLVAVAAVYAINQGGTDSAEAAGSRDLTGLRGFDGIVLAGPDRVIVSRGRAFSVRAEGESRVIDQLDISVRNNVLHVERKKRGMAGWFSSANWGGEGATVRVTLPVLRRATLAGSGDMRIDIMANRAVEATVTGSGDLGIGRIEAQDARLSIAGSGTLTATGRVATTHASIAGSGDLRAERLEADTARVSIAGSGDAFVQASKSARISIVGSGDATVRGTRNCEVSKVGSGDAHCAA